MKLDKQINNAGVQNTLAFFLFAVSVSSSVSCLLYLLFYHYSSYFWSFNEKIPYSEALPYIRLHFKEHDGIEGYVLYVMMFVNIIISFLSVSFFLYLKNKFVKSILILLLIFISSFFFIKIGFYPPMSATSNSAFILLIVPILVCLLFFIALKIFERMSTLFNCIFIVLLIPICFIAISPIVVYDYSFLFFPAIRILNGFGISEIYFRYDVLLSLIAFLWMKLHININYFQIVGQVSYFLFFIGLFFFSKSLFINKKLSVSLLVLVVIIKYFALGSDPISVFEITPLRLDLWILILFFIYEKGVYHWTVGFITGLLVLLHKNFGIIYLASYIELCGILFLADILKKPFMSTNFYALMKIIVKKHFILNSKNFLILVAFALFSIYLFNGLILGSALDFQKIGIGFLPIAPNSFYWYFPIISSMTVLFLYKNKPLLSERYFSTSLFIVLLAIGNSMYFFGRSHENNIINISGILLLNLFLLFDLLNISAKHFFIDSLVRKERDSQKISNNRMRRLMIPNISVCLPVIMILLSSFYYSNAILTELKDKAHYLKEMKFIQPINGIPSCNDFAVIKKITNNSLKVYFLEYDNFVYYYYGNYTPIGYYNPSGAWIFKKDFVAFLQNLLKNNYYLVISNPLDASELLPYLKYTRTITENKYTAIKL
ncbi:MAG: hypothetical protein HY841_13950 [Bacteroidetes bacterium]|nr:hypothetical protein [Bacteroidota bacterium]